MSWRHRSRLARGALALALLGAAAGAAAAGLAPVGQSLGQRVYLPVYSHTYQRSVRGKTPLAATIVVRNTDALHPIFVEVADYHDSAGKKVRGYADGPHRIAPLSTVDFVIDQRDDTGGAGASFIIVWRSDSPVTPPVVEAVMIGVLGNQSFSFKTEGKVLAEAEP